MKREIVCAACSRAWSQLVGKYPGEEVKLVPGTLLHSCRCDSCGDILHKAEHAVAVSVSTPSAPYHAWENHYLELPPNAND